MIVLEDLKCPAQKFNLVWGLGFMSNHENLRPSSQNTTNREEKKRDGIITITYSQEKCVNVLEYNPDW